MKSGQEKRLLREVSDCERMVGSIDYERHCINKTLSDLRRALRESVAKLRAYHVNRAKRSAKQGRPPGISSPVALEMFYEKRGAK